ncbi:hypothetical protein EXIGLDRAFT_833463 [Exidia glandulosa HHB12029]|uniref:RNI-like protein n=1 Tax=Exidia glandulosa HHB12029 TaxID=1314781 RepID=A0A165KNK3_EXIGL|nr:hypothetical protein EXIGLDRAFT_833463 [Exidia glandulosa HHB12029]
MGPPASEVEDLCSKSLANLVNLRSCSWTRDGSFSNSVIEALARMDTLRGLEFNGHSGIEYSPRMLLSLRHLTKVSIIMPDRETAMILPEWLDILAPSLRSLSLICKSSGLITDSMLRPVAHRLTQLDTLHLTGCTRISAACVEELLAASAEGISSLRLEGLHYAFDLQYLAAASERSHFRPPLLRNLRALTITFISYHDSPIVSLPAIQIIISHAPLLSELNLHPPPPATRARLPGSFIQHLVQTRGGQLRKLAINRVLLGRAELAAVCDGLQGLEQLYITLLDPDMAYIADELRKLPRLWAVHLNFPFALDAAGVLGMSNDDEVEDDNEDIAAYERAYTHVAKACTALCEFGVQNRVWQVERACYRDEAGDWRTDVRLGRRENPSVAEQFLVMRI